ncbi:MAG: glycosyltransferase [Geopsychrobacter sp.]|nr:glycosyltransferase [Geopsychrobacter sp.]
MEDVFLQIKLNDLFRFIKKKLFCKRLYENVNQTQYSRNCLLLYIVEPFFDCSRDKYHQNFWQVRELGRIVSEFGYNVDVIDFFDDKVELKKKYDMVIDLHPGLNDVYLRHVSEQSVKIAYITGSNPSVANVAELERIKEVYKRKGVMLVPRRAVQPIPKSEIESFDAMFFIGNQYNLETFKSFDLKSKFLVRNTGYEFLMDTPSVRRSSVNFLFLASIGQVHKGLDLLLEIFCKNPHLNLYVCSSFESEKDFLGVYKDELFNTPNIFPLGFIDITSEEFKNVCEVCSFVILPSCSEGLAGSVLTAMSAGLVPIVTRECGFNDDEVHHLLSSNMEDIGASINYFSRKSREWISNESRETLKVVKTRYSTVNYSESIREAMKELLLKGKCRD